WLSLPYCRLSLRERPAFRGAKGDKLRHYRILRFEFVSDLDIRISDLFLWWIQQLAELLQGFFASGHAADPNHLAEELFMAFDQFWAILLFEFFFFFLVGRSQGFGFFA